MISSFLCLFFILTTLTHSDVIDIVLNKLYVTEGEYLEGKIYINNSELLNTYNNIDDLVICTEFDHQGLKTPCYPVTIVNPHLNIKLDRLLKGNIVYTISWSIAYYYYYIQVKEQ